MRGRGEWRVIWKNGAEPGGNATLSWQAALTLAELKRREGFRRIILVSNNGRPTVRHNPLFSDRKPGAR